MSFTKKTHSEHIDMAIHQGLNGLRSNGIAEINDTNNNYNNKHHTHHKRSAGVSGEASSSKRTKFNVPSDKNVKEDAGNSKTHSPHQSHYKNIMEKLKDLYKELKKDKSCKDVSSNILSMIMKIIFDFSA